MIYCMLMLAICTLNLFDWVWHCERKLSSKIICWLYEQLSHLVVNEFLFFVRHLSIILILLSLLRLPLCIWDHFWQMSFILISLKYILKLIYWILTIFRPTLISTNRGQSETFKIYFSLILYTIKFVNICLQ